MRILITGTSGFIGGHLVQRLAAEHEVWALQRRTPVAPHAGVTYVLQDLTQPLDRDLLPDRMDAIIHQAAWIHPAADEDENQSFLANVAGTWRMVEYARRAGVHTFLHASTGGIYGPGERPFVESDPPNPVELYSVTKTQAETAVLANPGAFHTIILRYFFPYGVGTPNPMPSFIRRAVRGEPISILASGRPRINPLHISDAVEATVRALALGESDIINVAGEETTNFGQIASMAARHVGREPVFVPVSDTLAPGYYSANIMGHIGRMRARLDFTPRVMLAEGLIEMFEHERALAEAAKPE